MKKLVLALGFGGAVALFSGCAIGVAPQDLFQVCCILI